MIKIDDTFKGTQIELAVDLLLKYVREGEFWSFFRNEVKATDLSHHDLLEDDDEIINHIKFMFSCELNIEIRPYRTKWPWSSVIGYAEGNRVYENTRKINDLTLHERIGHIGHEIVHLFGYHHEYQGQDTSAAVVFGRVMEAYARTKI